MWVVLQLNRKQLENLRTWLNFLLKTRKNIQLLCVGTRVFQEQRCHHHSSALTVDRPHWWQTKVNRLLSLMMATLFTLKYSYTHNKCKCLWLGFFFFFFSLKCYYYSFLVRFVSYKIAIHILLYLWIFYNSISNSRGWKTTLKCIYFATIHNVFRVILSTTAITAVFFNILCRGSNGERC